MADAPNLAIAKRSLAALDAGAGSDELAAFFAPDIVQEELPNRLLPNGATRDLEGIMQARARGRALLCAERFEVLGAVASGDRVALEVVWTGTVAADAGPFRAGQELRARFAVFLDFRDGRIARMCNYDCFDPWDAGAAGAR
jgi:ketosteroid isomerase-like protein